MRLLFFFFKLNKLHLNLLVPISSNFIFYLFFFVNYIVALYHFVGVTFNAQKHFGACSWKAECRSSMLSRMCGTNKAIHHDCGAVVHSRSIYLISRLHLINHLWRSIYCGKLMVTHANPCREICTPPQPWRAENVSKGLCFAWMNNATQIIFSHSIFNIFFFIYKIPEVIHRFSMKIT